MDQFSIKEIEALTGIKAHTIRIWEQRYGVVCPKRTENNIRFYTSEDLRKLLNVTALYNQGFKISKIASMDEGDLCKEVQVACKCNSIWDEEMAQLKLAMLSLDEDEFNHIIQRGILQCGVDATFEKLLFPFVIEMGNWWQTGMICTAHEHFVSHITKQTLLNQITNIVDTPNDAKRVLLYLPAGEMHELSLLYAHYKIKKAGFKVLYLGQCVPVEAIKTALKTFKPAHAVTHLVTSECKDATAQMLNKTQKLMEESNTVLHVAWTAQNCPSQDEFQSISFSPSIKEAIESLFNEI